MPKVTEEHVEARRRQILSAALACFAREGFQRTTMQDIFREAELSPGAVYSYFGGKQELVEAIVAEAMVFATGAAAAIAEASESGRPLTPGEAFLELVNRFRDFDVGTFDQRTRIIPLLIPEAQRNPKLGDRIRIGLEGVRAMFEQLGRAAQERGELDPAIAPDYFGRLPIALFQGLMIQRGFYGAEFDVDAFTRTAAVVLDGAAPEQREQPGEQQAAR
jgi:AcrR family transcriptional regulator